MFCSTCGKPAAPGETTCAYCHASLALAGVPAGAYPQPAYAIYAQTRMARHVQIIGILWAVRGILPLFGWLIAVPFIRAFAGHAASPFGRGGFGPWDMFHATPFWIPIVTAFVVLHAALSLTTAYALLTRQSWGRVLAIVASILGLIRIPFGTALSIYTLIILLPTDAAAQYAAISTRSW